MIIIIIINPIYILSLHTYTLRSEDIKVITNNNKRFFFNNVLYSFIENENGSYGENIERGLLITINNKTVKQMVDEETFIIIFNHHYGLPLKITIVSHYKTVG